MGYPQNPPNPPFPPPPPGSVPPQGGPPPGGGGPWPPGPPGPPPPRGGGRTGLILALVGGGLVVVLILVVGAVLVVGSDDGGDGGGGGGLSGDGGEVRLQAGDIVGGAKATPSEDGSLAMARPGVTSPVVEVYTDFACPHCGTFDKAHDPMLKEIAVNGDAKVVFRPMVVFNESQQPAYGNSGRAASALRCVGDGARWLEYQDALYEHQPATLQTEGYATTELISIGRETGVGGAEFAECVREQWYAGAVGRVSERYVDDGVRGTPTARIDGRTLEQDETATPQAFRRAIEAAS